jgi:uncharacterized membrane protein YcjF (UPF0283 family)
VIWVFSQLPIPILNGGYYKVAKDNDDRNKGVYFGADSSPIIHGDLVSGNQKKVTRSIQINNPLDSDVQISEGNIESTGIVDIPDVKKQNRSLIQMIALGVLFSAILGLASDLLAAYLFQRFDLVNDPLRIIIVASVFIIVLTSSIWLSIKQNETAR